MPHPLARSPLTVVAAAGVLLTLAVMASRRMRAEDAPVGVAARDVRAGGTEPERHADMAPHRHAGSLFRRRDGARVVCVCVCVCVRVRDMSTTRSRRGHRPGSRRHQHGLRDAHRGRSDAVQRALPVAYAGPGGAGPIRASVRSGPGHTVRRAVRARRRRLLAPQAAGRHHGWSTTTSTPCTCPGRSLA